MCCCLFFAVAFALVACCRCFCSVSVSVVVCRLLSLLFAALLLFCSSDGGLLTTLKLKLLSCTGSDDVFFFALGCVVVTQLRVRIAVCMFIFLNFLTYHDV